MPEAGTADAEAGGEAVAPDGERRRCSRRIPPTCVPDEERLAFMAEWSFLAASLFSERPKPIAAAGSEGPLLLSLSSAELLSDHLFSAIGLRVDVALPVISRRGDGALTLDEGATGEPSGRLLKKPAWKRPLPLFRSSEDGTGGGGMGEELMSE